MLLFWVDRTLLTCLSNAVEEEKLSEDIDQMFELTRIIVLVLAGLVPNLTEDKSRGVYSSLFLQLLFTDISEKCATSSTTRQYPSSRFPFRLLSPRLLSILRLSRQIFTPVSCIFSPLSSRHHHVKPQSSHKHSQSSNDSLQASRPILNQERALS